MGREPAQSGNALIARLEPDVGRINFYRFCQLLEKSAPDNAPLGSGDTPAGDAVRFRPHPGMGFPVSELKSVEYAEDNPDAPPTVRATFMGLYGVDSPLPTAYTDDIAQRREGHEAAQAFLDIFNHRILTQFYRIWRKYSYPATFEDGGKDNTSRCLLGLIGLGIPGTEEHIATPVSRFLALTGIMRQPGRTAEGIVALVKLLAPYTRAVVTPHDLRIVPVAQPAGLSDEHPVCLDGCTISGDEATDANSQLRISLVTDNPQEAEGWLPDGQLYVDFLVLLRVYLGWRYRARIELTVPTRLLPVPVLGDAPLRPGLNCVCGLGDGPQTQDMPEWFTVEPGYYRGLAPATSYKDMQRVHYRF
ncbi:type VI secretion system baseplate subunit TssG [Salmonella enterica subsp. enterica]|nr:type VI secretion system baseplate subunit TssG [Salmonella enterica subsp. enterica]